MDDADPKDVVPQLPQYKRLPTFTEFAVDLMERSVFLKWLEENQPYAIRFWRHQWEKEQEKA